MNGPGNNGDPGTDGDLLEIRLNARPVSRGMAVGRIVCIHGSNRQFYRTAIPPGRVRKEIARFRAAHGLACRQVNKIAAAAGDNSANTASIFDVHRTILEDSTLKQRIEETIEKEAVNAEWAVKLICDEYVARYRAIPDEHFRDRYIDVEDVAEHLQTALGGRRNRIKLSKNSVVVAKELRPSTFAELSSEHPAAIITENGGWTSHTFILAREMEVPAVTGIRKLMRRVQNGEDVIVDAFKGQVILNPSAATLDEYRRSRRPTPEPAEAAARPTRETKTLDGREIKVRANFDIPESFRRAKSLGAQGIGLYRSEYLFNRFRGFPGEAEQVRAYREIAQYAGEHRARIRTFDLSVQQLVEHSSRREQNPALGLRAIRLGLTVTRHLRTQLRALLQAALGNEIDVIIPMVTGVDEIRKVRELIDLETRALKKRGTSVGQVKLGAMIEVPSAVLNIKEILEETDCLSLGTNDLVQYLLAADRDNESVSNWFRTLHPAVISALKMTIEAANAAGKPLVICGEMAGSPFYVPILLGLGATELSMNVNSIARVRKVIAGIAYEETRELVAEIAKCRTADEIEVQVEAFIAERWNHLFPPELLARRRTDRGLTN